MAISNVLLKLAGRDIFTCPANEEHAVTCVVFCNHSGTARTITVHAIPNGGALGVSNIIMKNLEIAAEETFTFDTEKFVLSGGDKLHVVASIDDAITATVSSMRVS
jgi:hypothetical protein